MITKRHEICDRRNRIGYSGTGCIGVACQWICNFARGAAVLAVIFMLHWARAIFIPLMLGVMISYALSPPVNLMQKWRIPRAIGAAVLLLGIVGGIGSLGYSLSDDAGELIETLPDAAQKIRLAWRKERERPRHDGECANRHPNRAGSGETARTCRPAG
jgi:hypothetical protein